MNIKSKAKKAIPYSIGISVINVLVALFGMVLLVRYLEAFEYGVYAILSAMPMMMNKFFALGYDQYLTRYVPGMHHHQDVSYTVWHIISRRVLLTALISLLLVLSFDVYSENFGLSDYYLHFIYYQGIVILFTANDLLRKALLARFSQKIILLNNIITETLRVSIIIYGVHHQLPLIFFIKGLLGVELLGFLMFAIHFNHLYKLQYWASLLRPRKENKDEKSYRWGVYVDKLGGSFLSTDIDRYILAYLSTNMQVAIYAVSTKILTKMLNFYPGRMFQHVIAPALYSTYDRRQLTSDLNRMFKFVYSANNIIGILFLAIFVPLGMDLLQLVFQQDYIADAYWPITFFLIFLIFNNVPLNFVAQAIKKPRILVISKLAFIFNLAIGIPAAYYFGALGMAIATASSGALRNVIIFLLINKHIRLALPWKATLRSAFNGMLTILLLLLLHHSMDGFLLMKVIAGVMIYGLLSKANTVFDQNEHALFVSLVPAKLQRFASALI
jgi:O-antigen/teichoic acid export membrane protein